MVVACPRQLLAPLAIVGLICGGIFGIEFATARAAGADDPGGGIVEVPFAARSGPKGATLFTRLSPKETGIITENSYADPKMWRERIDEFRFGSIGTGVAAGDYDNDGRPDLFVVNKTGPCRLFRNLGGWNFADVTASAGLDTSGNWTDSLKAWVGKGDARADTVAAWKQGATFADVDNDGWLDLYVCRFDAPNWLFMNRRDGTFHEEAAARGLALVDGSAMGTFCDYDRDGWLDVYVQTNLLNNATHPAGQRDHLFRNNGDGTFADVSDSAGISGETQGHSATWWDYDSDGWPDLYVANDFAPPDRLYRNNRDGTFTDRLDAVVPHQPYSAMGADLGDVDNDGRVDFFVADMAATTHEKDQRGMANSRALTSEGPANPAVAQQCSRNALYLNTGVGSFLEGACLTGLEATDWTWAVRWEDLDNDGRLDLFATNGVNRDYQNTDLWDRTILAESPAERIRLIRESPVLAQSNLAFRNLGDLQFESVGPAWGLDETGVSFGAAFADFDGDGDLDLAHANYEAGASVLRNDSDAGHRVIFDLNGRVSNRDGVGALVRIETASGVQVRPLVLARGYLSSSEPILHFGLGDDTMVSRVTVEWPSGHVQTFADLPADRRYIITEPASPAVPPKEAPAAPTPQFEEVGAAMNLAFGAAEKGIASPNSQPLIPVSFHRRGPALAVGDVDGDNRDDLVHGGTSGAPARVVLAGASGRLLAGDASALGADLVLSDGPLLLFDVDADGHDDLLVTRAGTARPAGAPEYQPRLFRNDGRGHLTIATGALPSLPISVGAAAACDFDRDGRLDVFLGARVLPGRYPRAPQSALLANRGGRFEDVTDAMAPGLREVGMVSSALWSDVDGDGWLDLLLALEWGGVRYWRNNQGSGFDDRSETAGFAAAGSGWWTSLAAADFNGDRRPDYVAGNIGLNTTFHASPEHPAVLFYGAFSSGGAPLCIEAYYEEDKLYPWRTRKELGAKIPAVLRKFPRNDAYAKATVEEILGKERLDAAERFVATEFRSGVFLSQAGGTFRFGALPRIAQIAPFQGVAAGDFDGDGKADIYAVQNSWSANPAMLHLDGGISQLLRGDGRGNFAPVPPAASGLVVPGDAKALVVLDLDDDGWPDFVATQNNGTTLAFRNAGVAGRGFLRVRLRGPAGNANAIGARVTCELADQSSQTCEIGAGSGYYSQATSQCFFGYPKNNPPRRLHVRWSSGATTGHEVPRGGHGMVVSAP
jgi:hypothetical protein